jgi:GAF domain-containing protein
LRGKERPTRRGPKPAKSKVEATSSIIRKSRKREGARVHDLEKRLAEALKREADALERETATSEILRVISQSPADVQPVFDTILANALRLCEAHNGGIFIFDGQGFRMAAVVELSDEFCAYLQEAVILPGAETPLRRVGLTPRVSHVADILADPSFSPPEVYRREGMRTSLAVPMRKEGRLVGALAFHRRHVRPFSDKQIALLETFADQAVIAIENVRLFKELDARNRELTEALERQTATSEILKIISRSPTDLQPVLQAMAESAAHLCLARDVLIMLREDQRLLVRAHFGSIPRGDVVPVVRESPSGRAVLDCLPVHVEDLTVSEDLPVGRAFALRDGVRTALAVPLLCQSDAIGAILVRRDEVRLFTDKQIALLQTFADQAVIAIENVRLFKELQEKNRALTEAHAQMTETLEQQTATSEILRVIAGSPTALQPVLDALVESAGRLCEATDTFLLLVEGDQLRVAALHGSVEDTAGFSHVIHRGWVAGRAVVDGRTVHVEDLANAGAEFPLGAQIAIRFGHRTALAMPLFRTGVPIGALFLRRREVRPFSAKEIALLATFADQAVIAIENVRLFKELEGRNRELSEALEQQTATAEILRVISQSQTDVQPVFDAIVQSAVRLCDGLFSSLFQFDGEMLHPGAAYNYTPEALAELHRVFPARPTRTFGVGRAILERASVLIPDVEADADYQQHALSRAIGWRSGLFVPMLREGVPIGVIMVSRAEPGPFPDNKVAVLQTFADQAVIAIENVRLFTELQEKNQALTQAHAAVSEALDRQTATAEILGVISSSPTDIQPVFATIADNAMRLLAAWSTSVWRYEDGLIRLVAARGGLPGSSETFMEQRQSPAHPAHDSPASQTVITRMVFHSADVEADASWGPPFRAEARMRGFRSIVAVPMLRAKDAVGVIAVTRAEVGGFTPAETALLKTFADQAVIAIENVRLFKELEARTQELTRSVSELRALSEVGQAISSTLDLQAVLSTIVARATNLSGTDAGVIYEYDDQRDVFLPRATAHLEAEIVETMLATPVRKGEGATGRLAEVQEPIQVPDIQAAPSESRVRGALVRAGYRALLAIPLAREGHLIGGLTVIRKATGAFAPQTIELLQTFATQSSLAIQNARLFREIEVKSRELQAASQHKSEFLANMSHELRTPLNAIIGFSEVLGDRLFGELNEKQDEYLRDIHASGQHLLSLINDVLDLSKIEAGRMELELAEFHLPTAIDNALVLVRERALRRGITLEQSIDPRLGQMQGDERKVKQVLLNLLSNAIKFTPDGGRISVRAMPREASVEVSVSDTGVGIAPEEQEAIFEEFRQVGTAAKKVEGTGLGLTLSRKFIELHGGRIWVESQLGMGSTFTFTIPTRIGP